KARCGSGWTDRRAVRRCARWTFVRSFGSDPDRGTRLDRVVAVVSDKAALDVILALPLVRPRLAMEDRVDGLAAKPDVVRLRTVTHDRTTRPATGPSRTLRCLFDAMREVSHGSLGSGKIVAR